MSPCVENGPDGTYVPGQWLRYPGEPTHVDHRTKEHAWHNSQTCTREWCGATPADADAPDRPLGLPAGATFRRDLAGDVVMEWPGLFGGSNVQLLEQWIRDNCPPGTTYDVMEAGTPDGVVSIITVRLECERTMKYDEPLFAEFDPAIKPAAPRVFHLVRYDDVSFVSGTGIVAQGMQARDGAVALRWCVPGLPATWNLFDSIEDMLLLNGHKGRTVVKWADGRD